MNILEQQLVNALYIVNQQTLHQWCFMFDEEYRIGYYEMLDDWGIDINDTDMMVIPVWRV